MSASTIRGVVGVCGLITAGAGLWLYSPAVALTAVGAVVFTLAVWGEVR